MGWTGKTFTDYRCWYVALFPAAMLFIMSAIVLSIIIMVCVLYLLILHSAVKAVDKINGFRESTSAAYVNKAFELETRGKISHTKVTVTVEYSNKHKIEGNDSLREHRKVNIAAEHLERPQLAQDGTLRKVSKLSIYVDRAKALNAHPTKLKAIKTVLLFILCFVGTWTPYYITVILYAKCKLNKPVYDCVSLEMLTLGPLFLLGICNSLCDPLIYAWRHSGFKRTLRRIYHRYVLNKESSNSVTNKVLRR